MKTTSGSGIRQVPKGGGEWRENKMEETSCEVFYGTPTTVAVEGKVKVKEYLKVKVSYKKQDLGLSTEPSV